MSKGRKLFLIFLPFLLLASTALVFKMAGQWLGAEGGYLVGFAFYWGFWGLLVPRLVLGRQLFAGLLTDKTPLFSKMNWYAAALLIVVTVVTIFMYTGGFLHASPALILLSIPLAATNGICEEVLWRGTYVQAFPGQPFMGMIFPSFGFALWHFAPQVIFPHASPAGFVFSTLFLGLSYGWIAFRTGSARWPAISHSLNGILALSGMLAPSILVLLQR